MRYGGRRLFVVLWTSTVMAVVSTGGPAAVTSAALPSKEAWLTDVRAAMRGSHVYIDDRVARGGRNLAVNFDIDNTTLASHYDPGNAVLRVLRFANHARNKRLSQLFNTARHYGDGRISRAKKRLNAVGYHVTQICGRHPGETITHSKQRCRRQFVADGYTLVANVGNRSTDFVGGSYERAFRLPNYGNQLN